jgi:hypothetical protein
METPLSENASTRERLAPVMVRTVRVKLAAAEAAKLRTPYGGLATVEDQQ